MSKIYSKNTFSEKNAAKGIFGAFAASSARAAKCLSELPTTTLGHDGMRANKNVFVKIRGNQRVEVQGNAQHKAWPPNAGCGISECFGRGYRCFFFQKGFTLIELLVVVLIIGILAAIALPQYQKAVMKTRVMALRPLLRSINDAQCLYYMANGAYTANFSELDISMPAGGTWTGDDRINYAGYDCFIHSTDSRPVSAYCNPSNAGAILLEQYFGNNTRPICWVASSGSIGEEVCKNISGKNTPDAFSGGGAFGYYF